MDDITPPPAAGALPFVRPAEYYESPQTTAIFPRWVPIGCGTASLVFLICFFVAGALIAKGGGGRLLDGIFGTMQSEIDGQFTKDVTPQQRKAFDDQMNALRGDIRASRMSLEKMQPLLQTIRAVSDDDRITPDEANQLIQATRQARGK